jgi:hypothetical protein
MLGSKAWWSAAGIRALRTFAQALLATIPATIVISEITDLNAAALAAANILGSAALAAILSLLTSVAGLPEVKAPDA